MPIYFSHVIFLYLFLKEPTETVMSLKSWLYELEGKYSVKSRNRIFSHQTFRVTLSFSLVSGKEREMLGSEKHC